MKEIIVGVSWSEIEPEPSHLLLTCESKQLRLSQNVCYYLDNARYSKRMVLHEDAA